jgi:hypothetical protein
MMIRSSGRVKRLFDAAERAESELGGSLGPNVPATRLNTVKARSGRRIDLSLPILMSNQI